MNKEMNMDNVKIGDRIRYESAAGTIYGEVVNIFLAKNAKRELIPWLRIERIVNNKPSIVIIAGTDRYLKMMKFNVIFRDAVAA